MAMKATTKSKSTAARTRVADAERGINLDVPGKALIAQADERIKWHRASADLLAGELKALSQRPAPAFGDEWKLQSRKTDLQQKMNGHLEYARFLTFVRRHMVARRIYRLGLVDMSHLEIMPKGSYL